VSIGGSCGRAGDPTKLVKGGGIQVCNTFHHFSAELIRTLFRSIHPLFGSIVDELLCWNADDILVTQLIPSV
jgi:hypothetical protein